MLLRMPDDGVMVVKLRELPGSARPEFSSFFTEFTFHSAIFCESEEILVVVERKL